MTTIGSTVLSKVSMTVACMNYATILEEVAPREVEQVVDGLEKVFAGQKDLAECDNCGGWSPPDLGDACPFCGVGEEKTEIVASPATVDSEVGVANTNEIDATQIEASGVPLEPSSRRKKKNDVIAGVDYAIEGSESTTVARLTGQELVEVRRTKKAPMVPKPSTPLLSLAGGRSLASEKELDAALEELADAGETNAEVQYRAGHIFAKIHDRLWQQRTEDGKPKYKSFDAFIKEELSVGKTIVYRMMRIVAVFSLDQWRRYGISTLSALLSSPKEELPALLAKADEGATTRQLKASAAEAREARGLVVSDTPALQSSGAAVAPAVEAAARSRKEKKAREAAAITVGLKTEQCTVRLYARKGQKRGSEERPATCIDDEPYGVIEGMNGVNIYLAIKSRPSGELEVKVTARRSKDE